MTVFQGNLIPRQSTEVVLTQASPTGVIAQIEFKRGVSFEVNIKQEIAGSPTVGVGSVTAYANSIGGGKRDEFQDVYDLANSVGGGWTIYHGTAESFEFTATGITDPNLEVIVRVNYWVGA